MDTKLYKIFLTHISEEEEPYTEDDIENEYERYKANMLSEIHKIKFSFHEESEDKKWKIIVKNKNNQIERIVILYENNIVLIYTLMEINLLEIKKGKIGKEALNKLKSKKYKIPSLESMNKIELK